MPERIKILHCCLANFYIDNYGYQENILTRMHKLLGYDVAILASTETYIENRKIGYISPNDYYNEDNIPVSRVAYIPFLPLILAKKLRIYKGISKKLNEYKPDIIFIHDSQFLSITKIVDYVKKHSAVRVYIDSHTDYGNSAKNWLSKNILHKIIYRWCTRKIEPYVNKFYGTLPSRADFYRDIYKVPESKLDLLVFGADHSGIDFSNKDAWRNTIRKDLRISDTDLVFLTGGKIDKRKNIHSLLKAFNSLKKTNLKLIIFGQPNSEIKKEFEELIKGENVRHVGWVNSKLIYQYFLACDIAIFPGTHSVLWEQAVGLGVPCIFRRWQGMEHIDLGGNCIFIETDGVKEIEMIIREVNNNRNLLINMNKVSKNKGKMIFSYLEIAKRSIEI